MEQDEIIRFINNVIIEKGIQNDLSDAEVRKLIADYKEYIESNGLASKKTLNALEAIVDNAEKYYVLSKSFKAVGLEIPPVIRKAVKRKPSKNKSEDTTETIKRSQREENTYNERCTSGRSSRNC